ncbi:hypothetical protein EDD11_001268 [Mortierella claussenii]|nr:hypothetical protein EDD11_001268 [Mortierella claussenii]
MSDRSTALRSRSLSSSSTSTPSSPHSRPSRPRARGSWTLRRSEKPNVLDTTPRNTSASHNASGTQRVSAEGEDQHAARHIPVSPPASPLPLRFRRASNAPDVKGDTDSSSLGRQRASKVPDDHKNVESYRPQDVGNPRTPTSRDHEHPSRSGAVCRTAQSKHSDVTANTQRMVFGKDVHCRPRFSLSTNLRPRPLTHTSLSSTVVATAASASPSSAVCARSAGGVKEQRAVSRNTKSTSDATITQYHGHNSERSRMMASARLAKSRPPTTITTTTTSRTRRVVSTVTSVGQRGDINQRKESTTTTTVVAAKELACKSERPSRHHTKSPSAMATRIRECSTGSVIKDTGRNTPVRSSPVSFRFTDKEADHGVGPDKGEDAIPSKQEVQLLPPVEMDERGRTSMTASEARECAGAFTISMESCCKNSSPPPSPLFPPKALESDFPLCSPSSGSLAEDKVFCGQETYTLVAAAEQMDVRHRSVSSPVSTPPARRLYHVDGDQFDYFSETPSSQNLGCGIQSLNPFNTHKTGTFDPWRSTGSASPFPPSISEADSLSDVTIHSKTDGRSSTTVERLSAAQLGSLPIRTSGILTRLDKDMSRTPLTKAKDPAVMFELLMLMKNRREHGCSLTHDGPSGAVVDAPQDEKRKITQKDQHGISYEGHRYSYDSSLGETQSLPPSNKVKLQATSRNGQSTPACTSFQGKKAFLDIQIARRHELQRRNQGAHKGIDERQIASTFSPPAATVVLTPPQEHAPFICSSDGASFPRGGPLSPLMLPASMPSLTFSSNATTTTPQSICYPTSRSSTTVLSASTSMSSILLTRSSSPSLSASSSSSPATRCASPAVGSLHVSLPNRLFRSRSSSPIPPTHQQLSTWPSLSTSSVSESRASVSSQSTLSSSWSSSTSLDSMTSTDTLDLSHTNKHSSPRPCSPLSVPPRMITSCECSCSLYQQQHADYRITHPALHEGRTWERPRTPRDSQTWSTAAGSARHGPTPLDMSSCTPAHYYMENAGPTYRDHASQTILQYPCLDGRDDLSQRSMWQNSSAGSSSESDSIHEPTLQQSRRAASQSTHDISMLTKRLANVRLMDSLCPRVRPDLQQQPHQILLDSTWASQIQQLLIHLAEQADLEDKTQLLTVPANVVGSSYPQYGSGACADAQKKHSTVTVAGDQRAGLMTGLHEQVLGDWIARLDQLADIVYSCHPGLKREVDKIRWQHGIVKRPICV